MVEKDQQGYDNSIDSNSWYSESSYESPNYEEIIDRQRRSIRFTELPIKSFDAEFEWGECEVKELYGARDTKVLLDYIFANIKDNCRQFDPILSRSDELKGLVKISNQLSTAIYLFGELPSDKEEDYCSLHTNSDGSTSLCISINICDNIDKLLRGFRLGILLLLRKMLGKDWLGIDVHNEAINFVLSKSKKGKIPKLQDFEKCTLIYSSNLCLVLAKKLLDDRSFYDTEFEPSKDRLTFIHRCAGSLDPVNNEFYKLRYAKIPEEYENLSSERKVSKEVDDLNDVLEAVDKFFDPLQIFTKIPQVESVDIEEEEYPETYIDRQRGNRRTYSNGDYSHSLYSRKQKKLRKSVVTDILFACLLGYTGLYVIFALHSQATGANFNHGYYIFCAVAYTLVGGLTLIFNTLNDIDNDQRKRQNVNRRED